MHKDNIMVVSPGYLDSVYSCISKYTDFSISGYSDIAVAINSLKYIPGHKYLGFAYLHDSIRGDDVDNLKYLLELINSMYQGIVNPEDDKTKVPFIFLLSKKLGGHNGSPEFLGNLLDEMVLDNLTIGFFNYEYVSDRVIKTQMFGSILLHRRPFEVKVKQDQISVNCDNNLKVDLPFTDEMLDLFSPLSFKEVDTFFKKHAHDKILCLMRSFCYDEDPKQLEELTRLLSNVDILSLIKYRACYNVLLTNQREWSIHEKK